MPHPIRAIRIGLKKIWSYFAPSWEGDDGKLSYRRASQFVFILLIFKVVVRGSYTHFDVQILIILTLTFLLLAGLIVASDIIKFANGFKGFSFRGGPAEAAPGPEDAKVPEGKKDGVPSE